MESHLSSADPLLIDNLSFVPKGSADYVLSRKASTFYQAGSNIYSTVGGTRVLKITVNDSSSWLDPSTLVVQFDLKNGDTGNTNARLLRTISGSGAAFWRRMRVISGNGTILEDVDNYNQCHELFEEVMKSDQDRSNNDVMGMGRRTDGETAIDTTTSSGIPGGSKRTVSFAPYAGILRTGKYLPLKYMNGLTFEFELVSNATDVIVTAPALADDPAGANDIKSTNTSNVWQIENPQIKCQLVQIDNSLQNRYDAHMLEGKSISIAYSQIITSKQTFAASKNIAVNITRSCSRLQKLFVTLYSDTALNSKKDRKNFNTFAHPGFANNELTDEHNIEFQAQLGSKQFPERPMTSISEQYYHLKQALGYQQVGANKDNYHKNRFAIGLDMEQVPGMLGSGINTKDGQLLTIKIKNSTTEAVLAENQMPTELTTYLIAQSVVELSDSGSLVLD